MKRILIVEDEPDIQELLRAYLEDAGYQTAVAGDGVAALALFGGQPFDLVLLDLMLPKIDGFGVCELIRQQSQIPILMLTALDGEESQLRGFGMDIDDYAGSIPACGLCPMISPTSVCSGRWPGCVSPGSLHWPGFGQSPISASGSMGRTCSAPWPGASGGSTAR